MQDFAFISHVWLGKHHPDPKGVLLSLLKSFLQQIIDGGAAVNNYWLEEIHFAPSCIEASALQASLRNGYIWIDYLCAPQHDEAEMLKAVNSIHCYVQEAAHFMVVQPSSKHENGHDYDMRTWSKRGWCRLERLCNALSLSVKPVIMVETMTSRYTAMQRDWLLNPVGVGDFTVDSDRERLQVVIDWLVSEREQHALGENDLPFYRLLASMRDRLLCGCGSEAAAYFDESFEQWMERMRFTAFDDEEASGWSPLRFAIYAGRLDIARELLRRGADVEAPLKASYANCGWHIRGCTILGGLCGLRPYPEGVRFLLRNSADPFLTDEYLSTPLHLAGGAGLSENMSELMSLVPELAPLPDVHGCTPWLRCVLSGNKEAFVNYAKEYPGAMNFHPNWCNWYGAGVLCHAIMDVGDAETLKAAIELGYDVNHRADITEAKGYPRRLMKVCQAISYVSSSGSTLILYMANFPGFTALTCSAFFNNTTQLKMCLEARADVSTTNDYNRTALMFAAMNGNEEMVQILLDAECPLCVTDSWKRTAADWAQIRGHSELADKLRRLGDVRPSSGVRRWGFLYGLARCASKCLPCVPFIGASSLPRHGQWTPNISPPSRSPCGLFQVVGGRRVGTKTTVAYQSGSREWMSA